METRVTHYGDLLQRMGVEMSPDDNRTEEEIFNELNRQRLDVCIATETDPHTKKALAEYALNTYPLETDKV